jgi:hypothetical protein
MPITLREFYRSSSGDTWSVAQDSDAERIFIRHEPNARSGGQLSDMEFVDFIQRSADNSAEMQGLLQLIGTLTQSPSAVETDP